MSTGLKAVLIITGIVCLFGVTTALVRAVSSGEDFSWLSVSEGGIWIGDSGSEGESVPEPNTLEFIQDESQLLFSGNSSNIVFSEGGQLLGVDSLELLSTEAIIASAGPLSWQFLDPKALLFLAAAPVLETMSAGIMTLFGDVGITTGYLSEEGEQEFYPRASVLCTQAGDVIIRLGDVYAGTGYSPEGEGDRMMGAAQEALSRESASTSSGIPRIYSGKLPRFHVPRVDGTAN
jgi:hypothetical protein